MSRICMVVHSYYLRDGRVRREAEALAEPGHQVDVICLRDQGEIRNQIHNRVHIYRVPVQRKRGSRLRYMFEYGAFFLLASLAVSALHLRQRYDIIHIHTLPDFLVFVGLVPRWLGVKTVLDVHDLMPESFISKDMGSEDNLWMRLLTWVESKSFRFPDHIVTIHEPYAQLIAERSGRDLAEITPIMNLADEKIFCRSAHGSTGEHGGNSFVMLYAGTVAKRYGVDTAIRAVPTLAERIPGFKFVVLGEGEHKIEFERLADDLDITDVVEFHAPVGIDDVPSLMAEADVGVSSHVDDVNFRWAFPQKVYEYLRMGLPVVASRTEVLEHYYGDAIVYVPAGDSRALAEAVFDIYRNPDQALEKTKRADQFLSGHNWAIEKGKLLSLVDHLTGKD